MKDKLLELTADIVSAYVGNNTMPTSDLAKLVTDVSNAISRLAPSSAPEPEQRRPAVNPKRSMHDDYMICLEDGRKFKSLKRHLMAHHGLTPEQYRAKWGLAADYPMVAPTYAAKRSQLAKEVGLGRKPSSRKKPRRKKQA
jgi:predicted transcriptional regulator